MDKRIPLAEARARAINAEPWQPIAGLVKRQCPECGYFYATPELRPAGLCLECQNRPSSGRNHGTNYRSSR